MPCALYTPNMQGGHIILATRRCGRLHPALHTLYARATAGTHRLVRICDVINYSICMLGGPSFMTLPPGANINSVKVAEAPLPSEADLEEDQV